MDRWASLAGRYSGATAEKAVPFPRVACRSKGYFGSGAPPQTTARPLGVARIWPVRPMRMAL